MIEYKNTIFFLDNNKKLLKVLKDHFFDLKADKEYYYSSEEAEYAINLCIKNIKYKKIILIVDYSMPLITGINFCNKFSTPNIKKIIYSNVVEDEKIKDSLKKGLIDQYVKKDIASSIDDLEVVLENYI